MTTQGKKLSERISEVLRPAALVLTGFSVDDRSKELYMSVQRQRAGDEATPSSSIIQKVQDITGSDISLIINGKHMVSTPPADAPLRSFLHHVPKPISAEPN